MAMIDGKKFSQDRLLDVAGHVLHAYFKAPQTTVRSEKKAMVVHGQEVKPILEFVEKLEEKLGTEAVKNAFLPLYVDYQCMKVAADNGFPPVIILLGADLAKADLGWNCGSCGFPTCGEFTKYKKKHGGMGRHSAGPSCSWKTLDYGISCDYACAAAWELNVDNRILGSLGFICSALGYLDDVSITLALILGPPEELWWYSRPSMKNWSTPEQHKNLLRNNYTFHYQMFSTDLRPQVKKEGPWWEGEEELVTIGPDKEYGGLKGKVGSVIEETIVALRPKVQELKSKM
jgi:uncharacterized ferredoxin-like protein